MSGNKVSTFRERFNELIESSPKSRTAISQEFGVAKQTISAWATGQSSPRLPVVSSLADYFDVDVDWLMGFDVPKRSPKPDPVPSAEPSNSPKTIEARIIADGVDQLPPDQREQALNVLRAVFSQHPELFKEERS